jgi:hypothetical protein
MTSSRSQTSLLVSERSQFFRPPLWGYVRDIGSIELNHPQFERGFLIRLYESEKAAANALQEWKF